MASCKEIIQHTKPVVSFGSPDLRAIINSNHLTERQMEIFQIITSIIIIYSVLFLILF